MPVDLSYAKEFHPEGEAGAATDLTARRILEILRRRWLLFLGVWLLFALGGIAISRTFQPVYRPQATLEVRPETTLVTTDQPEAAFLASLQMWANFYRTQETLLRSPSLIQDVLATVPRDVSDPYFRKPDPVQAFADNLDVEKTESSFIMKVAMTDPDPNRATVLVNALVARYLEEADGRIRALKNDTLEVLTKQTLPAIRQRFDEADQALRLFQQQTGFADFEVEFAARVDTLKRVDARLTDIRMRSFKISSDVNALRLVDQEGMTGLYQEAFQSTKLLESLGAQRAALLTELARQTGVLKDQHPRRIEVRNELARVEAQIHEAIQGTLQSFFKTMASLGEEEVKLAAEKSRLEKDMADSRRHLTEFKRLDAELVTAKELYNTYLKKLSETRATTGTGQAGVRVVDAAIVPREPYKKPHWIVGLGAVLGLLFAAGSVGLAEFRDDRLRSAREVEIFLGLDVLGEIPEEAGVPQGRGRPLLLPEEDPESPAWEAYRGLRAHLVTRLETIPRGRVILVSSPGEGEGKSTVAANLARSLAMDDQRVLLFDAELRWPIMKALLADPMGTGLEELLRGELTLREAVQSSRIPGVDVLGADTGLLWASEMAGSSRFQSALKTARDLYDFIVIDSAPVNLVSDTALIARRADAALLVVRQGRTSRADARLGRKKLEDMKAPLMGAVVIGTKVPPNHFEYRNRRDPAKEARILEKEGDNLVGVV